MTELTEQDTSKSIRICSWNVAGILPIIHHAEYHYGSLAEWLDTLNAEIICFQEVKLTNEKLTKEIACTKGYETFWSLSKTKKGYSGVATFVKQSTYSPIDASKDVFDDSDLNDEGRCIQTDHGKFVLFNVYVPNAGDAPERARVGFKLRFLANLRQKMDEVRLKGKSVVLIGDLNIPHTRFDVTPKMEAADGTYGYSKEEIAWMTELVGMPIHTNNDDNDSHIDSYISNSAAYIDVHRQQYPIHSDTTVREFTCWDQRKQKRLTNDGVRIDYIVTDKEFYQNYVIEKTSKIHNTPTKWSDHAMISVDIRPPQPPAPHKPCDLSSLSDPRFKPAGQSLFTFFGKKTSTKKDNSKYGSNDTVDRNDTTNRSHPGKDDTKHASVASNNDTKSSTNAPYIHDANEKQDSLQNDRLHAENSSKRNRLP